MSFPFRERSRLSDRYRGKTADELLNELKSEIDSDRKMFFDTPFPRSTGFPFDDNMSRGHQDIRSHLEDLAQRHPEFADQLRCPPWGGEMGGPSQSTWRRARQGSSGDEPLFPQSTEQEQTEEPGPLRGRARQNNLPTHGLRNTVDLGQQQHEAELDKANRGQRSMSAPPPDNRASEQPQRYVSRIDINPLNPGSGDGKPPAAPKQQQPSPQKPTAKPSHQGTSNVRHIPIFVEGRDEPVVPKNVDSVPDKIFSERVLPTQSAFTSERTVPPQSPFQERTIPTQAERGRRSQSPYGERVIPTQVPPQHSTFGFNRPSHFTSQHQFQPQQQTKTSKQPQEQPMEQEKPATPPPQPKVPESNDPLSRVQAVQKDVNELAEKVEAYSGNSRKDKNYIYLDEMLTRNLLKLDIIETEGKDNVRQARKAVIRNIQRCISILESKAPIPGESMVVEDSQVDPSSVEENESEGHTAIPNTQEQVEALGISEEKKLEPDAEPMNVEGTDQSQEVMNVEISEEKEPIQVPEPNIVVDEERQPDQLNNVESTEQGDPAINVDVPLGSQVEVKDEQLSEPITMEPPCVEMAGVPSQQQMESSEGQPLSNETVGESEQKTEVVGENVSTGLTMEMDTTVPESGEVASDIVPDSTSALNTGDKQALPSDSQSKGKKGGKKGTGKSKKSVPQTS